MRRLNYVERMKGREQIIFPVTPEPYREHEPIDAPFSAGRRTAARKEREHMPYRVGEIVFARLNEKIKLVRIYTCQWHLQTRLDEYIPMWKVQAATLDGHWSGLWANCYPGYIYRAYFDDDDKPRTLPTIVERLEDLFAA